MRFQIFADSVLVMVPSTLEGAKKFARDASKKKPNVHFYVYDTSDPKEAREARGFPGYVARYMDGKERW